MKRLTFLLVLALVSLSLHSAAVTISYGSGIGGGAYDRDFNYLEGSINPSTYSGEYIGTNPLVQLMLQVGDVDLYNFTDDIVLDQTTIGAGRYTTPFNGEWEKSSVSIDVTLDDSIYVRVFGGPDTDAEWYGVSASQQIKAVEAGTPSDYVYLFPGVEPLALPTIIPEPFTAVFGLFLIAFIRKRFQRSDTS